MLRTNPFLQEVQVFTVPEQVWQLSLQARHYPVVELYICVSGAQAAKQVFIEGSNLMYE